MEKTNDARRERMLRELASDLADLVEAGAISADEWKPVAERDAEED